MAIVNMRNLREMINLIEASYGSSISESFIGKFSIMGDDVKVYKNPTESEFFAIVDFGLRGSIDGTGDLYVWDAAVAIHSQVEEALGIVGEHRVMMYSDRVATEYNDRKELRKSVAIKRAYGKMAFDVVCDGADF